MVQINGFQWDDGNREKCCKHGVPLQDIEALFVSGSLIVLPDPFPGESRLRGIGQSSAGRHIFVVWTIRAVGGLHLVRPISARYMHAKEVEYYEQA
ncbi:BrnT family toxin [uncultured Devosia sp.]|uniref:BrnT family toxin n=1 Tax=uncultured Devosia sp. TaxID=211434 RepID=UPI0035CAC167